MLLRYLVARLRHPASSAKSFIRAGLGLETRAQLLSAFWTDHFSRSRAAQSRWARAAHGDVLTVLGAGPLHDFNAPALSTRFKRFRLVDANPLLSTAWSRLNNPVEPVITDITNCIPTWAESVKTFRGSWSDTLNLIQALGRNPTAAYSSSADAVLSLNILSQLEIVWQETLEPILNKRFGRSFVTHHEQEWLAAMQPSAQMLIQQHLAALQASQAPYVLLISDLEYVEYTGRIYSRRSREEPPISWNGDSWNADDGIKYESYSALEGLTLDNTTLAKWMPSYQLEWHDTWLWHIAPYGTETTTFGKLHRVGAFALRHRDSATA